MLPQKIAAPYLNELLGGQDAQCLRIRMHEISSRQKRGACHAPQGKVASLFLKVKTNVSHLQHVRA